MAQQTIDGIKKVSIVGEKTPLHNQGSKVAFRSKRIDKLLRPHRRILLILSLMLLIATLSFLQLNSRYKASINPFPRTVTTSLGFTLYFPATDKLPIGYSLDVKSLKYPIKGVIVFTINYGNNNQVIFSEQKMPSNAEIQSFNTNYIPLRNFYQTPVGQAEIGAYKNNGTSLETLVSLPTIGNTWIIITAPPNIEQHQLEQLLLSITK